MEYKWVYAFSVIILWRIYSQVFLMNLQNQHSDLGNINEIIAEISQKTKRNSKIIRTLIKTRIKKIKWCEHRQLSLYNICHERTLLKRYQDGWPKSGLCIIVFFLVCQAQKQTKFRIFVLNCCGDIVITRNRSSSVYFSL